MNSSKAKVHLSSIDIFVEIIVQAHAELLETPREVLCWPGLAPGALAEPGVSSQAGADIVLTFLTPAGFTRTNVCVCVKK